MGGSTVLEALYYKWIEVKVLWNGDRGLGAIYNIWGGSVVEEHYTIK